MSLIAKPLLAALLATGVASIVAVLRPDPLPTAAVADADLLPARKVAEPVPPESPWQRTAEPVPTAAGLSNGFAPPPPPPPPAVVVAPPPAPMVPPPSFSYLGRLEQDGKTFVFLGQGSEVEAIAVGSLADSNWRIEAVTAATVELRYLPLNETRQLALSDK